MNGTSSRFTLQFLKEVSYDKLHSMEEGIVFRGSFSEDPCLCSLLLQTLPQKLLQDENFNIPTDSIISIFESRDLIARDPENRRLFKEELYLVLRIQPSHVSPLPIPTNPNYLLTKLCGWTGLIGPSISSFETTSTSDTNLLVPYHSISLPSKPEDTLLSAIVTAQASGIDLTLIKLAYISRGYLNIPSSRSKPDSLVLIFENDNASNTAGWSVPNQPPPLIEDIKGMESLRRLYELEARTTAPHTLTAAPPPSKPTQLDRTLVAAMRNIKVRNSQILQAHERRITDLEHGLKTLMELNTLTPDHPAPAHMSDKQKKKKKQTTTKKAADSTEE